MFSKEWFRPNFRPIAYLCPPNLDRYCDNYIIKATAKYETVATCAAVVVMCLISYLVCMVPHLLHNYRNEQKKAMRQESALSSMSSINSRHD